jgi:glycosyltransferase involved in cell wall biosynthesis
LTYRKVLECIQAVLSLPEMRMVIMGPCDDQTREMIRTRWPDYKSRIYITGWVAQSVFFRYMDKAITSLVFYENIDTNHWLCAPNRFYNAILRGIPVICGPNPPMKRIVEKDLIGISCLANGEDSVEIAAAIIEIRDNYPKYKNNCLIVRNQFVWQNQEAVFARMLTNTDL